MGEIERVGSWSQVATLPSDDSATAGGGPALVSRQPSFTPEYVQWSLRHRNLRRTSGIPMNNMFW